MRKKSNAKEKVATDKSKKNKLSSISNSHANDDKSSKVKDNIKKKHKDLGSASRSKGVYLLPNLFTIGNIFSGFFAIVSSVNGKYEIAAIAIFVAMIFDLLDGRVARLINAQSEFGAQLDSLADVISFGITPALVLYNWSFLELKEVGWGQAAWLGSFLYVACVALRLAKFNMQVTEEEDPSLIALSKRYFFGLPCPAAAALIASLIWMSESYSWNKTVMGFVSVGVAILISLTMVSNILYRSFKDLDLKSHVKFILLIWIVIAYMVFWRYPAQTLFGMSVLYFISGPVVFAINLFKRNKK